MPSNIFDQTTASRTGSTDFTPRRSPEVCAREWRAACQGRQSIIRHVLSDTDEGPQSSRPRRRLSLSTRSHEPGDRLHCFACWLLHALLASALRGLPSPSFCSSHGRVDLGWSCPKAKRVIAFSPSNPLLGPSSPARRSGQGRRTSKRPLAASCGPLAWHPWQPYRVPCSC